MAFDLTQELLSAQLRACIPKLSQTRHKGQFARLAVIGGSLEYSGAPHFAASAGYKAGADISYIVCCRSAASSIKSYSPETIVLPLLRTESEARQDFCLRADISLERGQYDWVRDHVVNDLSNWIKSFDVLVVGPGLGRDPLVQDCVLEIIKIARNLAIPMVIDGDGLMVLKSNPLVIKNYRRAILTPNVVEYVRLCRWILDMEVGIDGLPLKVVEMDSIEGKDQSERDQVMREALDLEEDSDDDKEKSGYLMAHQILKRLAKQLGRVTILKKGHTDIISDGKLLLECNRHGGLRRCGGQGDVLSGLTGTLLAWNYSEISNYRLVENTKKRDGHPKLASKTLLAAWGASNLMRECAHRAFVEHCRGTTTSNILDHIGPSFFDLCESQSDDLLQTQESFVES